MKMPAHTRIVESNYGNMAQTAKVIVPKKMEETI